MLESDTSVEQLIRRDTSRGVVSQTSLFLARTAGRAQSEPPSDIVALLIIRNQIGLVRLISHFAPLPQNGHCPPDGNIDVRISY